MALTRLKKHQFILFINTSKTTDKNWARIGKSTVFSLAFNAKTEESDYIEDESPTTELTGYVPSMDQELVTNEGDPAFDFIYEMVKSRATGEDAKKEFLLVFAGTKTPYDAWSCPSCTIEIKELNTVDQKITFALHLGPITTGKVAITANKPTFTAGA
nr:MAG TPA: GTP-binding nuclear protein [Caudoviricetes sp.]